MLSVAELTSRFPRRGRIAWIGLRPARRGMVRQVSAADVAEDGLAGDHAPAGERAVTLIQAEHLPVVAALVGRAAVRPEDLRRNLVVQGVNLAAMRGRQIALGAAVIEITGPCPPCSRMEETLGRGGYNAMRGHGGWYARVIACGRVEIGDPVRLAEAGDGSSEDRR